jgi:integrase
MTIRLDTQRGRDAVKPGNNAAFMRLRPGLSLGLRCHRKGGKSWVARIVTGPKKYDWKSLGDFVEGTFSFEEARRAAEAWAAEVERGVRGRDHRGKVATVETACREYVEVRRKVNKSGAHAEDLAFRRRVYGFKVPPGGKRGRCEREHEPHAIASVPLAKLHALDIRKWRDGWVDAGVRKATSNRELQHLKAALNFAVRERLAPAQCSVEVSLVPLFEKATKRRDIFLDRSQRVELMRAARDAAEPGSNGALCNLIEAAALTGARPGELVSMLRSAFDRRTESLTLSGKTGKRTVPLSPQAVALFTRLSESKLPNAPMLTRDDGKPWGHSDWDELMRAAAAQAELPNGTVLYTMRHSFITETLISARMSTLEVARLVGTSVVMIEEHYGHLVANRARENLAAVNML